MVRETGAVHNYRGQPILFNEDDHFDFEQDDNNFMAAIAEGASWGCSTTACPGRAQNAAFRACPSTGASTRRASALSSISSPR
jgi:hypothetical protein